MLLHVKVNPNSKIESINKEKGVFIIKLKEKAEKGKANLALMKILSKYFKISLSNIKIIKGLRSRNKIVIIKTD